MEIPSTTRPVHRADGQGGGVSEVTAATRSAGDLPSHSSEQRNAGPVRADALSGSAGQFCCLVAQVSPVRESGTVFSTWPRSLEATRRAYGQGVQHTTQGRRGEPPPAFVAAKSSFVTELSKKNIHHHVDKQVTNGQAPPRYDTRRRPPLLSAVSARRPNEEA